MKIKMRKTYKIVYIDVGKINGYFDGAVNTVDCKKLFIIWTYQKCIDKHNSFLKSVHI